VIYPLVKVSFNCILTRVHIGKRSVETTSTTTSTEKTASTPAEQTTTTTTVKTETTATTSAALDYATLTEAEVAALTDDVKIKHITRLYLMLMLCFK
jgi:hypothetical protein